MAHARRLFVEALESCSVALTFINHVAALFKVEAECAKKDFNALEKNGKWEKVDADNGPDLSQC